MDLEENEPRTVTQDFFEYWSNLDIQYHRILDNVKKELDNSNTLSVSLIKEILYWKYPGLPSKMNSERYAQYQEAITNIRTGELNTKEKITILEKLDGIGLPVASTILHFLEPEKFPIVDERTVKALLFLEVIPQDSLYHYRETINGFLEYQDAILEIKNRLNISLRNIDNALFSFHKFALSSVKNQKSGSKL